ncbi:MAG: cadherin-like domain-containing protein, partial [Lentisphaerae bacterium]|nr:cadherin-like domain-containing protein [Lentisphaerota bacterium]
AEGATVEWVMDTQAPTVNTVFSESPDGLYGAEAELLLAAEFSEDVTVQFAQEMPVLALDTGWPERTAVATTFTPPNLLKFRYTTLPGDVTGQLDYIDTTALQLNGALVQDLAGNLLITELPEPGDAQSLSGTSNIAVNAALRDTMDVALLTVDGAQETQALAINQEGQVAGFAWADSGRLQAIRWEEGRGETTPLEDMGAGAVAYSLNDSGVTAGYMAVSPSYVPAPALWTAAGEALLLPTLGGDVGVAYDISGPQAAGFSTTDAGKRQACLWTSTAPTDAPRVIGSLGGDESVAYGVAGEGSTAVGQAQDTSGLWQAFIWHANEDETILLPSPDSALGETAAFGVSDSGLAVGYHQHRDGTRQAVAWWGTRPQTLPSLGNGSSTALGVNAGEKVVGWAEDTQGNKVAMLWDRYGGVNLNTMIDSSSGWTLETATAINDAGQITGYGLHQGRKQAFVLSPPGRNLRPAVELLAPDPDQQIPAGNDLWIHAAAIDVDGDIAEVTFFVDGELVSTQTYSPFSIEWLAPTAGYHTIVILATDNDGDIGGTETIAVEALPDQSPVAQADAYTGTQFAVLEVSAPGVLGNDSDADNDSLTAVLRVSPRHGSVVLETDGSFRYTPEPGFSGGDTFVYEAVDPLGLAEAATVTVDIQEAVLTFDLVIAPGWNMISVPLALTTPEVEAVFPGRSRYTVWAWDGSTYFRPTVLLPGQGYWLRSAGSTDEIVQISGKAVLEATVTVAAGWSLMGVAPTPGADGTFAPIQPEWLARPAGTYTPPAYTWHQDDYETADELVPGRAYWIFTNQEVELNIAE